jgi:hypothetical protein
MLLSRDRRMKDSRGKIRQHRQPVLGKSLGGPESKKLDFATPRPFPHGPV